MTEERGEEEEEAREREREGRPVKMEMQLFQCPSFDRITSETGSWESINSTSHTRTGRERDVERAAIDDSRTTQGSDAVDG